MNPKEQIDRYIQIIETHEACDLDALVELLGRDGIDGEDAECLIAFVPMAFAHAVLAPLGVGLPVHYVIKDVDTGATARGRLDDEPIFVAARALARDMLSLADSKARALDIAGMSSEMAVVRQLHSEGSRIDDLLLTETLLARVPLSHLKARRGGFGWKFWKRD